jgi:hypothetical protein
MTFEKMFPYQHKNFSFSPNGCWVKFGEVEKSLAKMRCVAMRCELNILKKAASNMID